MHCWRSCRKNPWSQSERKFIWTLHPIVLVTVLLSIDCFSSSHAFTRWLVLSCGSIVNLSLPTILMLRLSISLFSCPEQLNRWPCHSLTHSVRDLLKTQQQNDPRDLWSLRNLIRVIRTHDLTNKKTMTKTNTKTKTMTTTNTFREHFQRATLETWDLWDIWSGWWGDMTWPKKIQWQWQWQIHLENTFKEQP